MAINIPQLTALAQQSVTTFWKKVLPLAAFSANFSADVKAANESVIVPVVGKPAAARAFTHAAGYAGQSDSSLTQASVQLTDRLCNTDVLTDLNFEALPAETQAKIMQAAALNVLSQAALVVGKKALEAAQTSFAVKAAGFDFAEAIRLKTAATKAELPTSNRVLMLDSDSMDTLISDPKISSAFVTDIARNALEEGAARRVAGMSVFEQPDISAADEAAKGFLALPYSMALASRATPASGRELFYTVVTDERTGFSLVQKILADELHAQLVLVTECLFGASVVDPNSIVKLEAASSADSSAD